jgi:hypothetical protein
VVILGAILFVSKKRMDANLFFKEQGQSFENPAPRSRATDSLRADFTAALKAPVRPTVFAEVVRRDCMEAGASLLRFAVLNSARDPSPQLEKIEYEFVLRGGYQSIKRVLSAMAERPLQLTIQTLRMQRIASASPGMIVELEAQVRVSAWGKTMVDADSDSQGLH